MSNLDFSSIPANQLEDVLNGPALQPPEGVEPNFVNPPNGSTKALGALFTCLVLGTIFLAIRFYVRIFVVKKTHLGDYLIIPAYAFFVMVATGSLRRILSGPGIYIHQWNVRARDMNAYLYICFIGTSFYGAAMLLMKWAILWEWIKVFVPLPNRNAFYWACQAMIAVNMVFYVTAIILTNVACTPYKRNWDKTIPGTCLDIKIINLSTAVVNLVIDMAIFALPQKVIWSLHMSNRRRVGFSIIFAIGLMTCVSAACRIAAAANWIRSDDMTYHFSDVAIWASAELACGILVFSIPALPKAFANVKVPGWLSSLRSWSRTHSPAQSQHNRKSRSVWPGVGTTRPRNYQNIEDSGSSNNMIRTGTPGGPESVQALEMGFVKAKDSPALGATSSVDTTIYDMNHPHAQV